MSHTAFLKTSWFFAKCFASSGLWICLSMCPLIDSDVWDLDKYQMEINFCGFMLCLIQVQDVRVAGLWSTQQRPFELIGWLSVRRKRLKEQKKWSRINKIKGVCGCGWVFVCVPVCVRDKDRHTHTHTPYSDAQWCSPRGNGIFNITGSRSRQGGVLAVYTIFSSEEYLSNNRSSHSVYQGAFTPLAAIRDELSSGTESSLIKPSRSASQQRWWIRETEIGKNKSGRN